MNTVKTAIAALTLCLLCGIALAQTAAVSGVFTDARDGREYRTVKIGNQVWMAENLNYNASGSICPSRHRDVCGCWYDWNTAMDGASSSTSNPSGVRGVCPAGWHLPSDAEWTALINHVGASAGWKLMTRVNIWHGGDSYCTDDYGFSAQMCGYGMSNRSSSSVSYYGYWWSATEHGAGTAKSRFIEFGSDKSSVFRYNGNKTLLFSVRCIQDVRIPPAPHP